MRDTGHRRRAGGRWLGALSGAILVLALHTAPAIACSPPLEPPSVAALPEGSVVLVGTTGQRVAAGRLFFVERVYAGNVTSSPIVIAFKEGEPIGDCSYPMSAGVHLFIAPDVGPDGVLRADLATLQADPASDLGRRFVAQAEARYGPAVVPPQREPPPGPDPALVLAGVAIAVALLVAALAVAWRRAGQFDGRSRSGTSSGPMQ